MPTTRDDFEPMTLNDAVRLALTVIVSGTIAFLGFFAEASTKSELQKDLRFSIQQIQRFESLHGDLDERAEFEKDAVMREKMKAALEKLDQRIEETRESLERASRGPSNDPFVKEHLRASLLALQDSASHAITVVIDADNKVGRGPIRSSRSVAQGSDPSP